MKEKLSGIEMRRSRWCVDSYTISAAGKMAARVCLRLNSFDNFIYILQSRGRFLRKQYTSKEMLHIVL